MRILIIGAKLLMLYVLVVFGFFFKSCAVKNNTKYLKEYNLIKDSISSLCNCNVDLISISNINASGQTIDKTMRISLSKFNNHDTVPEIFDIASISAFYASNLVLKSNNAELKQHKHLEIKAIGDSNNITFEQSVDSIYLIQEALNKVNIFLEDFYLNKFNECYDLTDSLSINISRSEFISFLGHKRSKGQSIIKSTFIGYNLAEDNGEDLLYIKLKLDFEHHTDFGFFYCKPKLPIKFVGISF